MGPGDPLAVLAANHAATCLPAPSRRPSPSPGPKPPSPQASHRPVGLRHPVRGLQPSVGHGLPIRRQVITVRCIRGLPIQVRPRTTEITLGRPRWCAQGPRRPRGFRRCELAGLGTPGEDVAVAAARALSVHVHGAAGEAHHAARLPVWSGPAVRQLRRTEAAVVGPAQGSGHRPCGPPSRHPVPAHGYPRPTSRPRVRLIAERAKRRPRRPRRRGRPPGGTQRSLYPRARAAGPRDPAVGLGHGGPELSVLQRAHGLGAGEPLD
mmetsp:Transcript_56539/g.150701  ORF Transcript_56539/g.150701 Transcript_56539/m.150701 type:complete len:265 (-) Transcript_56539:157-951(-)